ncbi:YBEY [Symbiodinium natans]|uniref:YBEY protein n=1 Tax=Symbiodinium natans TaxID=878477 RepID=A0A812KGC9_9DINO|nr:YBEY [Symbiodinium natans]
MGKGGHSGGQSRARVRVILCTTVAFVALQCLSRSAGHGWMMKACSERASERAASGRRASVVVTDVDGTLMNSTHQLPAANYKALRHCMRLGVPVILATGKHRGPWFRQLLDQVTDDQVQASSNWTLNAPGVFVQGLRVCDSAGQVVSTTLLPARVFDACARLAKQEGWTLLAYTDSDQIISNQMSPLISSINALGEPPVQLGSVDDGVGIHKLLFLGDPSMEEAVRGEVAAAIGAEASLTVAIPGMVEVLPRGICKADGVRQALQMLDVAPCDVLALGDGENDLEMLGEIRHSGGIAAAVQNARPILKEVAEYTVASCDEAGWAQAVERWVLGMPDGSLLGDASDLTDSAVSPREK